MRNGKKSRKSVAISKNKGDIMDEEDPFFEGSEDLSFFQAFLRLLTLPILFVVAALTKGISIFNGINDLANKESNRIIEMQKVLKQIGVKTIASSNRIKIFGSDNFNLCKKKVFVPNLGDHRICMSTFILAILTGAKTKINNFDFG